MAYVYKKTETVKLKFAEGYNFFFSLAVRLIEVQLYIKIK